MEPVAVKLDHPIGPEHCFGERVDTIVITRRVTAGDMKAQDEAGTAEEAPIARTLILLQRICRTAAGKALPVEAYEDLDCDDLTRLVEAAYPFVPGGRRRPSGGQPSESSP